MTYSQVCRPYSELVLCIYPSKCTHTAVNTHPEQWEVVFMLRRPGSSRGFSALLKASRHGIEGGESAVHSFPPPTIPAGRRLELTTFQL